MEATSKSQNISLQHYFVVFQRLFIIFWVFAFLGHYLEIIWSWLNHLAFSTNLWLPSTPTFIPLAPPYGMGVVAAILLTWPFIKRHEFNPVQSFVLNVFISALVEYLSAIFLVFVDGYNKFWNYSNQPFNLNGYICLENSLLFGLGATVFLYYIYPIYKKFIDKLKLPQLDMLFWIMFVSYGVDLILINFR